MTAQDIATRLRALDLQMAEYCLADARAREQAIDAEQAVVRRMYAERHAALYGAPRARRVSA